MRATGEFSTALGDSAIASGFGGTATGRNARATGARATANGANALAAADQATAVGGNSLAQAANSIALGHGAQATAVDAVATGVNSRATAVNSVALGTGSIADQANTVSVGTVGGERRVVNVAPGAIGAASTDAINGSQLFATNQNVAINTSNIATNTANIAGLDTRVTTAEGDIDGLDTRVTNNTTDIAGNTTDIAANDADIAETNRRTALALGGGAGQDAAGLLTPPTFTVQGGSFNNVGSALGALDTQTTTNTTNIAALANGTAGLVQQPGGAAGTITVGAATGGALVDFTGTAGPRVLTGVAPGALAATSTDAVNGSQLFATNDRVTTAEGDIVDLDTRVTTNSTDIAANDADIAETNRRTALALGGGAGQDAAGLLTPPTFNVQGGSFNNVGSALGALDTQTTTNTTDIAALANGTAGLVQQPGGAAGTITVGAATGGALVDFTGTSGPRVLTGVAPGALAATSTDAVNGSQLFATNQNVATNTTNIAGLDTRVTTAEGDIDGLDTRVTNNTTDIAGNTTDIAANDADIAETNRRTALALGGGAGQDAAGLLTPPSYTVQGGTFNNVGSALGALDTQTTTNTTDIAALANGTAGLVQQPGGAAGTITVGAATGGALVDFTGTAGVRVLTGVAPGALAATSTDAVNGSQLFATNDRVTTAEGDIVDLDTRVTTNSTDIAANDADIAETNRRTALALGGGAGQDGAGLLTPPSYTVQGGTFNNVGSALGALDTQTTTNTTNLATTTANLDTLQTGITGGTIGLVQQVGGAPGGGAITVGAGTGGALVSIAGTAGDRRLSGVAAGTAVNDAVNLAQLNAVSTQVGNVPLRGANTSGFALPTAAGADALAGGYGASASGALSAAYGTGASAAAANSVALGANSVAGLANTVSIGSAGAERRLVNLAAGTLSAASTDAVNGSQLFATNLNVATNTANIVGLDTRVTTAEGDIVILQTQIGSGGIGLVRQDPATRDISVGAATDGALVSIAGTAGDRTLTGVAPGALSAASTDAVNGSQLFATNQNVATNTTNIAGLDTRVTTAEGDIVDLDTRVTTNTTDIAAHDADIAETNRRTALALGGGAGQDGAGLLTPPSYTVQGGTFNNVGSALGALDTQTTTNTTDIAALANGTAGLVQQPGGAAGTITVGAATGGALIDLTGTAGPRVLTGVAPGALAATSTDAVNGSQLFATNDRVTTAEGDIVDLDTRVTTNTTDIAAHDADIAETNRRTALALGGGAGQDGAGLLTPPSYTVQGGTFNNVGSALGALDTQVTENTGDITTLQTQIGSGGIGLVQQDATTRDISVAAATDGALVDFTGTAGVRVLTGVAPGALAATSTDAVNGSQLFATNQNVATNTTNIAGLDTRVTTAEGDIVTNTANIAGLDTRVTTAEGDIVILQTQIGSGGIGLVRQDPATRDISVGAATDGALVSIAGTAGDRTLTGVAPGALSAASTDAVNGSQLFATNQNVATNTTNIAGLDTRVTTAEGDIVDLDTRVTTNTTDIAAHDADIAETNRRTALALGGGAGQDGAGLLTPPTFNVQGGSFNNVGSALGALDTQVTENTGDITTLQTQIGSGGIGLVQQDATTRDISVAAATDGALVDFTGTAGVRVLTGVAPGALAATSTDAVNGSQLFATNQNVATNTTNIAGLDTRVTTAEGDIVTNTTNIAGLDTRVTTAEGDIDVLQTQIGSGGIGLVRQDPATRDISVGAATDGALVSIAGTAGPRVLTGVAPGALSAASTDAVNGSQLFATNENVAANTTNIAGNTAAIAGLDTRVATAEGDIDGLDTRLTTAEGDVVDLDTRVTTNTTDIAALANGTAGLVQQPGGAAGTITVGAATGGALIDFTGTAGPRVLTGVAPGALAATSTDAVNGSQLFATDQNVAALDTRVTTAEGDIVNLGTRVTTAEGDIVTNTTNIAGLDTRVTTAEGDIDSLETQIGSGGIGLVRQDPATRNISVAAATDGALVDFTGTAGARGLSGVAAGAVAADSQEAVNGAQLFATNENVAANSTAIAANDADIDETNRRTAAALGGGAGVDADGLLTRPTYAVQGGRFDNVGSALGALDSQVTLNTANIAGNTTAIAALASGAAGVFRQDPATGAISVGAGTGGGTVSFAGAAGDRRLTGIAAGTAGNDAVNLNQLTAVSNQVANVASAVANVPLRGDNSSGRAGPSATGADALAGGFGAQASGTLATAYGAGAQATAANSVALGAGSVAAQANTVSIGTAGGERRLVNLAAGVADTDGVNVAQLRSAIAGIPTSGPAGPIRGNNSSGLADPTAAGNDALAGGYGAQASGTRSSAFGSAASATGAGATALGQASVASGAQSSAFGQGAQASASNSVALGAGSVADQANTVSVGAAGSERRVTNVAAGVGRTDGVNLGQLNDAVVGFDGRIGSLQQQVFDVSYDLRDARRNAYGGIASVAAMQGNAPYLPGAVAITAGVGYYRGEAALGSGVSYWTQSGKVNFSGGIGISTNDPSPVVRGGVTFVIP